MSWSQESKCFGRPRKWKRLADATIRGENMSWSQESKCFGCAKSQEGCVDHTVIAHAVEVVHYIGEERGHLGAGVLKMECQNYKPVNEIKA